ncbi:unnamed protein product [Allacma fusca]|uniref:Homologous-pairing protein 2 homolog n=1 Tax=Allacma fusca TaxID=39272 RepID=A0A8J2L329_9HEXA|nr:unnamed protein product [Allacma fusca]
MAEKSVLDYLTKQNRPYSLNDIVNNLLNAFGKAVVQKAIDKLVQDGKIQEKVYGKQKVYLVDQSLFKEESPVELQAMDVKIEELEKSVKVSEVGFKEAQAQLKELSSSLTMEEALDQVSGLTKETSDLEAKYKKLSEMTVVVDPKERDTIRKKRELYFKEWRGRKRRCMDMLEAILENYPKSKSCLFEEIGVETDEDVNVCIPK